MKFAIAALFAAVTSAQYGGGWGSYSGYGGYGGHRGYSSYGRPFKPVYRQPELFGLQDGRGLRGTIGLRDGRGLREL